MDTCFAIIMYCPRLFLLFTGKQHCLYFSGKIISVFIQNFKFGGVTVLAVQLFNKIKRKKKFEKLCFAVFPTSYVKIHLFLVNVLFFCMF